MKFVDIQNKIMEVMVDHIGEENFILSVDFFEKVYGENPEELDFYERRFKWDVILRANSRLRLDNKLFIITRYNKSFVLQSRDELSGYHKLLESRKKALDKLKENSKDWVAKKKWRKLKKKKKKVVLVQ